MRMYLWNIGPKSLGLSDGTHFTKDLIRTDIISVRLDFMILIYQVISLTDSLGYRGSWEFLLGNRLPEQVRYFSNEFRVTTVR